MKVEEAQAQRAELIAKVRNGTPPSWEPTKGWADQFTDDQIWSAWMDVAHDPKLTTTPMMVAATLVEWFIDGKLPR